MGAFEGDREHVDHNEQVAQHVDVSGNLFHISLLEIGLGVAGFYEV
jgi:hypothetical protein